MHAFFGWFGKYLIFIKKRKTPSCLVFKDTGVSFGLEKIETFVKCSILII